MTDSQKKIYDIIKDFMKNNGYAPTVREIGEIAGLKSSQTVFTHLTNLENKGFITYEKNKSRTIRILK